MKKAYLITIFTIAFLCICIGVGYRVGKAAGFVKETFKEGIKNLPDLSVAIKDISFDTVTVSDLGSDVDDEWTVDDADKVTIDASVSEIVIERGPVYKVTYEGKEKFRPDVTVSGKELKIRQTTIRTASFGAVKVKNKIIVTVPETTDLSKLEIKCNVGDVRIVDITSDKTSIDAAVGTVYIEDGNYDSLKITADVGEISVKKADFQEFNADASVGDIKITLKDSIDNYNFDLSASIADIEINGNSQGRHYRRTNASAEKYIDATASVGSMRIDGQ